ncbi:F-box domain-containing protein [Mycena indigotica]|uniref:F-box domain-containing protein n=1 Tax=Mycena indigotica TaxID=2126181 RepID=A0A8H6WFM8_9AGAR|nr:F-box domain-containing protein [Mycena indigotica]KAF7315932.1 F-box domain-containing protein [Mycena indigotica]
MNLFLRPRRRNTVQDKLVDGISVLPSEIWPEILGYLDDATLLSAAHVCRTFNRTCSELHMLRYGASLCQLEAGTAVIRYPTPQALTSLRTSLHLQPNLKLLSCRLVVDETFFATLGSLCRTVERLPKLEAVHFGVKQTGWLQKCHLDQYANLFHDLMFAMTSKGDGHVVHIDPGTRHDPNGVPRGRISVSSTRNLCHEQMTPIYRPLPRPNPLARLGAFLGLRKLTRNRTRIAVPTVELSNKANEKQAREWLLQIERKSWCDIAEFEHVIVGIIDIGTKNQTERLAVAAVNPHRTLSLRIRRTRWCGRYAKYQHQRLINEALPYLHLPHLKSVSIDAMNLDSTVFTRFLTRHAETLEQLSSEAIGVEPHYPHLNLDTAIFSVKPLPNVSYLRARSCAGLLPLLKSISSTEPCTLEVTFERWNPLLKQARLPILLAAERALLHRIATRTGVTTLKISVELADKPTLDEIDIALARSLRCVSTVHLSCMNVGVLGWLSYLPALKVLLVDRESPIQPTDEGVFLDRAQAMFSERGVSVALH